MRAIRLHDTLSGALRPLEPRTPGRVGIYACGPTVYARVHVGSADLRGLRPLEALPGARGVRGCATVENVTDVNDKIYDAARRAGVPSAARAR